MTKREFLEQAALNGFVGLGHQTQSIGGAHIVRCAESAWDALRAIAERDAAAERAAETEAVA
jgi:hypothetical protein